ncbi:bifunctional diguanylate cyclase/phosphodiesterase [Novosphingobium sp. FKTRR1]|uniref:putative bifunctional diguanylate cyclase/phosphodiesterase n=1 Tax=Novosphingobium sp. FKTRR1 TaxID=2879118 RepID=UPI001CF02D5E|nr:EAL domain-containing protein [Novosphingobium sp. FKTRR1]
MPFASAFAPSALTPTDQARDIALAQYANLRRQIPPLYIVLMLNAGALAFAYIGVAPRLLTMLIPGVLIAACIVRLIQWMMREDKALHDIDAALGQMRRTEILAGVVSVGFTFWALALDQYGNAFQHSHVAVFLAITVMGCIFCLTYLPRAAHIVCVIVFGAFLIHYLLVGNFEATSIAINVGLVGAVVLKVLRDSFIAFVQLQQSQRALVEERAQAQLLGEENARLAHSDPLTQLPNRRYFFARLDAVLARARPEDVFCIGVLDLDRFKPVNDSLGHAQGDRLLQEIGARLQRACGPEVTIARLGGDEFGIIVEADIEGAQAIGQSLCDLIQVPVNLRDSQVSVGCSGGLAAWPDAGQTAHDLFDRADFALYHAKKRARGSCARFSTELEHMIRSEQALESALQTANLGEEIALVYQPIVDSRSLEPVAVEALARWTSPALGPVPAEMLFATAERLGIARTITLTLFDKALEACASLPSSIRLSFNLAAPDIADAETISTLLARIATSGIDARRLTFEITETSLIEDFDTARAALEKLRTCGVELALDDFGTGYSSLSSLHLLPLSTVKIDRSFATRLDDPVGRRLVNAIRNLARSLNLDCVFEGIETDMQLMEATLAGFNFVQGYLIARPGALADVLDLQLLSGPGPQRRHAGGYNRP